MRHLWPLLLFVAVVVAMWFSSCTTPPVEYRVHSIQTITTICPGPLCAICADESTEDSP